MSNKPLKYTPMNKNELCTYFGISLYVLNKWLKPFEAEIGLPIGNQYNPKQVAIIFKCLCEE
jgi:hypothetical protein